MPQALQTQQREQLRAALLYAGVTVELEQEHAFVVSDVRVDAGNYIVAFCHTAEHAFIRGLARNSQIDPQAFSDSLVGDPELPKETGPCAAVGLVRVSRPDVGKPTLIITILRYVPMHAANETYQALLNERASSDESIATPATEEAETIHEQEPVLA
jgi:hypothetical protein